MNKHATARSVLAHLGAPSDALKSACARYLASLHTSEARHEAAMQIPEAERVANARAAVTARWARRPEGQVTVAHRAILAHLCGEQAVQVSARGVRRRAALRALAASGRIRIVAQGEDSAVITGVLH